MKIIRNNTPINFSRKNSEGILAMSINLEWMEDFNYWKVRIKDYEQIPTNSTMLGDPLYSYRPLLQPNGKAYEEKTRTAEQVNALFSQFNITIAPTDNFTDKFRQVLGLAAIYENQQNPPYQLNPADLEIVDTLTEVVQ